jgi:hypothetical protein
MTGTGTPALACNLQPPPAPLPRAQAGLTAADGGWRRLLLDIKRATPEISGQVTRSPMRTEK